MNSLSLTIQKLWPILKVFVEREMEKQTDRAKLYASDLSIRGHKNYLHISGLVCKKGKVFPVMENSKIYTNGTDNLFIARSIIVVTTGGK